MNEVKVGVGAETKLVKTEGEKTVAFQQQLLKQLEDGANEMGQSFSDYGKQCVINAIASLLITCKNQKISIGKLDPTMIRLALQNVGYTELNMAAIPSECYFELRSSGNDTYTVAIRPQGAGNEKLVRKYGVDIAPGGLRTCWLIREGDDFTLPSFDGLDMTPPKWTPKSLDKKVIMVVYPVVKVDGRVEYLFATRESIKPNLIAQIRQNALYAKEFMIPGKGLDKKKRDEFYEEVNAALENMTVDEILADPKWVRWVNPTYTSGGSKEQMILRKMKNNALKNYPKEYDNSYMADAIKNMFEDQDDTVLEKAPAIREESVDEKIAKTEQQITDETIGDSITDFTVDSETGEIYPTTAGSEEPDLETPEETEEDPF